MAVFTGGILLTFFSGMLAKMFGEATLRFIAMKVLITTLIMVTLPIILKNLIVWLMSTVYSIVSTQLGDVGISDIVINFTGIGAYIAYHLKVPVCLSIIFSAIIVKFTLRMIPFMRL